MQSHPSARVLLVCMRIARSLLCFTSSGAFVADPNLVGVQWDPGTCIFNKLPSSF